VTQRTHRSPRRRREQLEQAERRQQAGLPFPLGIVTNNSRRAVNTSSAITF
jgi:hypothetical protein